MPAQPDEKTVMQLKRLMNLNNQVRTTFTEAYNLAKGDFRCAIALNDKSSLMVFQEAKQMMEGLNQTALELFLLYCRFKISS